MNPKTKFLSVIGCVIMVGIAAVFTYNIIHNKSLTNGTKASSIPATATGCVSEQFAIGSTGHCVSDIQTMVNYMETAGLTECPFPGAAQQAPNGTYDSATQTQVKIVQAWFNCYNKEEGVTKTITADGAMGSDTWSELCTYAYKFPSLAKQSTSPYFQQSLAAGKDAGCQP